MGFVGRGSSLLPESRSRFAPSFRCRRPQLVGLGSEAFAFLRTQFACLP
jgi:hypothetical protein